MKLLGFSIAVPALMSVAVCGAAQAAPITSLPLASDAANSVNIIPVHYHHWHHHYWRHGYPIAGFWDYYRVDRPGRGTSAESTR
jgi:hypothetical protein